MEIRDSRLYRADFNTFEDYCRERWDFTRQRAHQLTEAAEVSTMVDVQNERQARELAPLKDDEAGLVAALREANEATKRQGHRDGDPYGRGKQHVVRAAKEPGRAGHGAIQDHWLRRERCQGCGRTHEELGQTDPGFRSWTIHEGSPGRLHQLAASRCRGSAVSALTQREQRGARRGRARRAASSRRVGRGSLSRASTPTRARGAAPARPTGRPRCDSWVVFWQLERGLARVAVPRTRRPSPGIDPADCIPEQSAGASRWGRRRRRRFWLRSALGLMATTGAPRDRPPAHRPRGRRHLGVSAETVLRWTRRGELPAIKLPGGAVRYREDELERWLEEAGDARVEEASTTPAGAAQRLGYPASTTPKVEED